MPQIDVLLKAKADVSGFKNIEKAAEHTAETMAEVGAKIGLGILGARTAAKLVEEEFRHVIEKIDEIPGIPQETVDSINRAKFAISEARGQVDQWIAKGVSLYTQLGEGMGYFFASLVYGQDAAADAYGETQKAANVAAHAAEEAKKKLKEEAEAAKEMAAAQKEAQKAAEERQKAWNSMAKAFASEDQVSETLGGKITRLRGEVTNKEAEAKNTTGTENFDANAEASKLRTELAKAEAEMAAKVSALNEKQRDAEFEKLSSTEKILHLNADLLANGKAYSGLSANDPAQLEQMVMLDGRKLEIEKQLAEEKKKANADELDALEKRAQRLQAERAIASQRGDKAEVNRLLKEERDTLGQIVDHYQAIADNANSTPAEKEAALARISTIKKSDAGNETTKIGQARQGFSDLSKSSQHFQSAGEGAEGGALEYMAQVGTVGDQVAKGLQSSFSGVASGLQSSLAGLINRTMTWGQALRNVWQTFGSSMLQAFTQMVAEYAVKKGVMFMIDVAFAAKGLALSAANAAKSLIMWIPSAIAASISSWGLAAAIGAAAVLAIVASKGFATGGYTSPGAKDKPAGIVHAGEWVAPKWMVNDPKYADTIASLEGVRRGAGGSSSHTDGYSFGGFVNSGWGRFLGSGGLGLTEFTKQGKNFSNKWNLFTGTQIYGKKAASESLVYDGKNWVNDTRTSAKGAAGAAGSSSNYGSSSAGGSSSSASSAANSAPIIYVFADRNEGLRAFRRDPETRKYIVDVVNGMT
jgi:hypothetical protein